MGEIIVKMYDVITQRAGYEGRLKFAEKIGIPRNKAAQIEDTPDLVAKCAKEASAIIGQDIYVYLK